MAHAIPQSEIARSAFVRELKDIDGALPMLLNELLRHNVTYDHLVDHMTENGPRPSRRLVKAMDNKYNEWLEENGLRNNPLKSEGVDIPVSKRRSVYDQGDDPADTITDPRNQMPSVSPGQDQEPMGGNQPTLSGDDDGTEPGLGGTGVDTDRDMDDPTPPAEDPSSGMDDPSLAGMDGDKHRPFDRGTADGMEGSTENYPGAETMPMSEIKKLFSHHHLISEMKKVGHMKSLMSEMDLPSGGSLDKGNYTGVGPF